MAKRPVPAEGNRQSLQQRREVSFLGCRAANTSIKTGPGPSDEPEGRGRATVVDTSMQSRSEHFTSLKSVLHMLYQPLYTLECT